jgi:Tol biopolymer transport system component
VKLKLTGQPFQVLTILLERPGEVVTRDELQKILWSDTFVDVDHNLNTLVNRIREVLGDSAESPRFVETLPRRGYRFIAPINGIAANGNEAQVVVDDRNGRYAPWRRVAYTAGALAAAVLLTLALVLRSRSPAGLQRALTRVTFDTGLQIGATWSPDGRLIAYSSNRGGKFDIWVQQLSGGDPVQVTHGPGQHWQPDWSPDGKYIAYRSEDSDRGLYIIPALGGAGLERKVSSFGYYPRWAPDSSKILFQANRWAGGSRLFYIVSLDGSPPRQILKDFLEKNQIWARSAAWHPDGRRVSFWIWNSSGENHPGEPSFLTVTLQQGDGTKSELTPELAAEMKKISLGSQIEYETDLRFSWAPSGDAIYFERTIRGAKNLWKLRVDPASLKALNVERLTTDADLDREFTISPDGKRVAFTAEAQDQRAWLFPFDAVRGRLTGQGKPITSPGVDVFLHTLTRDGTKLAFTALRAGHWELRKKSLPDGQDSPIIADDHIRGFASWSPDGNRLAYWRGTPDQSGVQLFIWSEDKRTEEAVSDLSPFRSRVVYDWSADGKNLLVSEFSTGTKLYEIWRRPAVPLEHTSPPARKLVADPVYDLWQSRLSPGEKWLVVEGSKETETGVESRLFLASGSGGPLTPLMDSGHFDDKPHWSPDGRTIYFLSDRSGFFDVWAIRFDATRGRTVGEPFRITRLEGPDLMVPQGAISCTDMSLSRDKLILNLYHGAGNIWVLDDVDR